MNIVLMLAKTKNNVISANGNLPWCIPEELSVHSTVSKYHSIVMGRKTWEGPMVNKTKLHNRAVYVLTSDRCYEVPKGVKALHTPEKIVSHLSHRSGYKDGDLFIVGGKTTFESFLPFANKAIITTVHTHASGDVCAPDMDLSDWERTSMSNYCSNLDHRVTTSIYRKTKT